MRTNRSHHPAVTEMRGLVTTPHPLATAAGLETFCRGGNAESADVDAAA